ncbi:WD domain, G-beta repeat [Rhizoctonia solani]|uniref:WD domain, G-beta repeat n=1 Tax=Rhizoctonia solani TaxID=456999 RepID=A0A8H7H0Q3_9AGAM|nr:WD domain, G-beta repeat [Rhizoctonia solani]
MPLIMTLQEALGRAEHKVKKRLGIKPTTVGHPHFIPCPLPSSVNAAKPQAAKPAHEHQSSVCCSAEPGASNLSGNPPETTASTLTAIGSLLAVLESSTDAIGPLKSAIGELKLCVDIYRRSSKDRKEDDKLAVKLNGIIGDLTIHAKLLVDPVVTDSVKGIQSDLMKEAKKVAEMQARSSGRRLIDALDGDDGIVECYRRIDAHLQRLTRNVGMSTLQAVGEQVSESRLARMCPTSSAVYRSAESSNVHRRPCTPGTRQAQIKLLLEWANAPDAGRTCWMNGMAGTGKTTIAYSVCAELEKASQLGASFFCSRTMLECSQVKNIVPSIAYQLARFSLPFRNVLIEILGRKPDAHTQGLAEQYGHLIIEPLKKVRDSLPDDFIVVIDALDECNNEESVGQILDLLMTTPPTLPIRFLISSRPENEITLKITGRHDGEDEARLVLHNLQEDAVKDDIELYMRDELKGIRLTRAQWSNILKRCGTLFIYASTACRFIKQEHKVDATSEAVSTIIDSHYMPIAGENPIDMLYLTILKTVFNKSGMSKTSIIKTKNILETVICAVEPMALEAIADLLALKSVKQVYRLLHPLRSVLHVPRDTGVVNTLHASFPDFILSSARSLDFFCDRAARHATLAQTCLGLIDTAEPKMNICRLPSSHLLDKEVQDLKARVAWAISPGLAYACRYWSTHLDCSTYKPILLGAVRNFFFAKLLLWMEVANLTGSMRYGVGTGTVKYAEEWCVKHGAPKAVTQMAHDAWQFVSVYANHPVCESTPHIYVSMLPFWPPSRPISVAYMPRTSDLVQPTGMAIGRRQLALMATWKVSNEPVRSISLSDDGSRLVAPTGTGIDVLDTTTGENVHSLTDERAHNVWLVAMSPDGTQVAFAQHESILYLWDIGNGGSIRALLPDDVSRVRCIAFSVDGSRVACGMNNGDVYVCSLRHTARSLGPLKGHTDRINSVAFSPDGLHLASGSADETIRVWNIQTGEQVGQPFKGHTDWVRAVCFTTDGSRLASGSSDKTVRVWNIQTGQVELNLRTRHSGFVQSVAFSPNGKFLASGSQDKTIGVYSARTGQVALGPFEGHTNWVNWLTFSRDGTRLFSCSNDGTVRIWNVKNVNTHPTPAVTPASASPIYCIRYAHTGKRVVSGSQNGMVHVWDTESGELVLVLLRGHAGAVTCVDYSLNDRYIASASYDGTLRIWNAHTGKDMHRLMRGHTKGVNGVRFLPDGLAIVSGSDDGTVRMWDISTGQQLTQLLEAGIRILSVGVSPDGQHVVCGSTDGTIQLIDRHGGKTLHEPIWGHTDWVRSVEFSDGMRFVSGSSDKSVRIWDGQAGNQLVVSGTHDMAHSGWVFSVSISPDGLYVASGSEDRTVRVWDGQTGKLILGPLKGHTDWVRSVQFSPNGSHVVSCSDDGTIRFWDVSCCRTESLEHGLTSAGMGVFWFGLHWPVADGGVADTEVGTSDRGGGKGSESWLVDGDGWVVEWPRQRVIWVPSELRTYLPCPPEEVRIDARGCLKLDWEEAKVGERWAECYVP